jgi:hypothetical protein
MVGLEILHQHHHHREIKAEIEQRLVHRQLLAAVVQAQLDLMFLAQPQEQAATDQQGRHLHLLMVPLALVEAQAQDGFLAGVAGVPTQALVEQAGLEVAQRVRLLQQARLRLLQIPVVAVAGTETIRQAEQAAPASSSLRSINKRSHER